MSRGQDAHPIIPTIDCAKKPRRQVAKNSIAFLGVMASWPLGAKHAANPAMQHFESNFAPIRCICNDCTLHCVQQKEISNRG
jgi:hypothetical protein